MFVLGLTGSIGMGKSTTAGFFAAEGCAVWDADAAVHRLYGAGGRAVEPMQGLVPQAIENNSVSRDLLKREINKNPALLADIERIVHPLVAKDRAEFLASSNASIAVLDIPLLFETGAQAQMDAVAVVWVDETTQRQRVMARGTMSEDQFDMILSKQMPIDQKKSRADYLIESDTLEHARAQVHSVIVDIEKRISHAAS